MIDLLSAYIVHNPSDTTHNIAGSEIPFGRMIYNSSSEQQRELFLDAWPIDPKRMQAFSLLSHDWVPLVPAKPNTADDIKSVQWMILTLSCGEAHSPCVYYGKAADVCAKYMDNTPIEAEQKLWIAPSKCGTHW